MSFEDEHGIDSNKRWGNSGLKGHGVNSPAMMEARKSFAKKKKELASKKKMVKISHKGEIGHRIESIGPGGKVYDVKEHNWPKK